MTTTRLHSLRTELSQQHFDACIVSELTHVRYLTGFSGSNGLCVVTPHKHYFLTDSRYKTQANLETHGCEIIIAKQGLIQEAVQRKLFGAAKRIAIESEYVSARTFLTLQKLLRGKKILSATALIEPFMEVKDKDEINCIRQAVEFSDLVFAKVLPLIKPGVHEFDLAAEISYWHRKFGADADAFEPIVASGPQGALPHAQPTSKKIRSGEFVVMDFGCRYRGYHSDITRTVAVGHATAEMKKIYQIVLEAQMLAIECARDGVSGLAVDTVARKYIQKQGYGKYFIHSLGHGLGMHVHDSQRLSQQSKDILKTGNVVTIEPGIYIPGTLGVRIEDDVVIRGDGCDVLNQSPKKLFVV